MRFERTLAVVGPLLLIVASWSAYRHAGSWENLWATPEQRASRLLAAGEFAAAAERTADPLRRGEALYRSARFRDAATAYAAVDTAVGAFDRGTALVMAGRYDDAIEAFDRALELRPGWREAEENRAIARVRRDRIEVDPGEGTGGMLPPDEIVVGETPKESSGENDEVEIDGGPPLDDDAMRALWLRRVETKPADFLRAKFRAQVEGGGR